MTADKVQKIAKWCTHTEVQKWRLAVGKFASAVHPQIASAMGQMCNGCPFRNYINVGGCLADDCPIHQVIHTLNRAVPRADIAIKDIGKERVKQHYS